jgi:hypothetical protein
MEVTESRKQHEDGEFQVLEFPICVFVKIYLGAVGISSPLGP